MTTFTDLNFETHQFHGIYADGIQAIVKFPNKYGASVVKSKYSYGGKAGLYELAVLDATNQICYTTSITDDVLGYLSESDVTEILTAIEALPEAAL